MRPPFDEFAERLATILTDPTASDWLKGAVVTSLTRDRVDAQNDADYLAEFLRLCPESGLAGRVVSPPPLDPSFYRRPRR